MSDETDFWRAVKEVVKAASDQVNPNAIPNNATCTLAGGAAVHYYTSARFSKDVDAEFLPYLKFEDVNISYVNDNQEVKFLKLDRNYNSGIGLLHPDAMDDADFIEKIGLFNFNILQPVDVAVSKLSRFAQVDEEDIKILYSEGLFTRDEFNARAEEALDYYATSTTGIKAAIKELNACWDQKKALHKTSLTP